MKLGFIGTGNMAGAIMGGIIGQGIIPASEIIGSDVFAAGREVSILILSLGFIAGCSSKNKVSNTI